jgi:hypothetical protein
MFIYNRDNPNYLSHNDHIKILAVISKSDENPIYPIKYIGQ